MAVRGSRVDPLIGWPVGRRERQTSEDARARGPEGRRETNERGLEDARAGGMKGGRDSRQRGQAPSSLREMKPCDS